MLNPENNSHKFLDIENKSGNEKKSVSLKIDGPYLNEI